jgi:hypothetical protein
MIGSILLPLGLPREQFFQHLYSPTDSQYRLAQVRPLHLYFLKLGLSRIKLLLQLLKPSLYLFPHGFGPSLEIVWIV